MSKDIKMRFIYIYVRFIFGTILVISSTDSELKKTSKNTTANTTTNHKIYVLIITGNTFNRPKKVATINTNNIICETSMVNIARVIVLGNPNIANNEVINEAISLVSTKTFENIAVV